MIYQYAWIASLVALYAVLGAAPLVLGTWLMVQRTSGLVSGLWLCFILTMLVGTLIIGALALYTLAATPLGATLGS